MTSSHNPAPSAVQPSAVNEALVPVSADRRVFQWHDHASLWFSLGVGLLVMQVGAYLMPALGLPLRNDPFYPEVNDPPEGDYSRPLQLLARSLRFTDPLTGLERHFESRLRLQWPVTETLPESAAA